MSKLQTVRGTRDLRDTAFLRFKKIFAAADKISALYGYNPIETPIFESTDVFLKPLGETSDIVGKEMYTFQDRGGDSITLRPEGTAPVVRAIISEGLTQTLPQKRILKGPMFRYERPQKGRYRQFYQISIECIGIESYHADVDVIMMADAFLKEISLTDYVLHVNTLGDMDSRLAYKAALIAYFKQHVDALSDDSKIRLEKNPLRILDSKNESDKRICQDAPKLQDYLNETSAKFFDNVCKTLEALNIPFKLDHSLVRGMDYYCHTVFEFKTTSLGAQDTILGGGRYDGLMKQMGGPETPAVGWACGVDRLEMLTPENTELDVPQIKVALLPLDSACETDAFKIMQKLRVNHIATDMITTGNIGKRLNACDKRAIPFAVVIGGDEIKSGQFVLKNLTAQQGAEHKQQTLTVDQLVEKLK